MTKVEKFQRAVYEAAACAGLGVSDAMWVADFTTDNMSEIYKPPLYPRFFSEENKD